jgi:hypothetical protein
MLLTACPVVSRFSLTRRENPMRPILALKVHFPKSTRTEKIRDQTNGIVFAIILAKRSSDAFLHAATASVAIPHESFCQKPDDQPPCVP